MYYPDAKPNVIHEKMAAISNQKGAIVTQNVDGLDRQAGAKHVVQFHGNLYRIYCQQCHQHFDYQTYLKSDVHAADGGIYGRILCYMANQSTRIRSVPPLTRLRRLTYPLSLAPVLWFIHLLDSSVMRNRTRRLWPLIGSRSPCLKVATWYWEMPPIFLPICTSDHLQGARKGEWLVNKGRLEAFTDAVIAIILTILVLN